MQHNGGERLNISRDIKRRDIVTATNININEPSSIIKTDRRQLEQGTAGRH